MRILMLLLLLFLSLFNSICFCYAKSMPNSVSISISWLHGIPRFKPSSKPLVALTPSTSYQGPVSSPRSSSFQSHHQHYHRHNHHHHYLHHHHVVAPSPQSFSSQLGCDPSCLEPMTTTTLGSPCGCVFPMKVSLLLNVPPFSFFPMVNELEIEVAVGIYLQQSQVRIMGAHADTENQGKTVVDIDLVPLGEKFDKTTAILTCERFFQKAVILNETLFGHYEVMNLSYEGYPFSPTLECFSRHGPIGSPGNLPVTADINSKNKKLDFRTIAVIALSVFVLLMVCAIAVYILLKWKDRRPSNNIGPIFKSSVNTKFGIDSILHCNTIHSTSASLASTMTPCILSVKTFSLAEVEKATEGFNLKRVLGEGGFGRVYHGILENGTEVAVKLLTRHYLNKDQEFITEVEMLSRLHHRNLVNLLGICIEGSTRCMLYELVRNGSVESHLHGVDKKKGLLDWDARMKIALGSARGLAYLHEDSNPRVIHRDFKASNVLLEDDFTPRVADFGLAREATEGSRPISTSVMGTFGYVAPEYAMTGHLLIKSDVYSYGVVLLELLSGRHPVDMSQPPGHENLVTFARPLLTTTATLKQLIDPSLNEHNYDFSNVAKVAAIASMCVHPEVTHRPFMGEVVQALKLIYDDSEKEGHSVDASFSGECYYESSEGSGNGGGVLRFSTPSSRGKGDGNRSGPLRSKPSGLGFFRWKGRSMSENGGGLLSRDSSWF